MKRFTLCTFLFFALFINLNINPADAQLSPKNFSLTSGSGVIASGIDAAATFGNGDCQLNLRGNNTPRFYGKFGCLANNWIRLDITGGYFDPVPWAGPQVTGSWSLSDRIRFTSLIWIGWSAGDNKISLENTQTMFWQSSNFLSVGLFQWRDTAVNGRMVNLRLSYSYLKFHIVAPFRAQHLVGSTISVPLDERGQFRVMTGVTMDSEELTPLFKGGLTYTFPK